VTVVDDAYNANPDSMAAALRAVAAMPAARRIAGLGEMLELGEETEPAHVELGRLAAELGVDIVVAPGAAGPPVRRGAGANGPQGRKGVVQGRTGGGAGRGGLACRAGRAA